MGYLPTLKSIGINQSQGYRPTLKSIQSEDVESPKTVNTFMGEMSNPAANGSIKGLLTPPNAEDIRKAGAMAVPFVAPEVKALPYISPLLSKIPGATAVGNMLGRIGYGTAQTTAPELFTEEGRKNIGESATNNLGLNALLEGATLPFRGAAKLAELYHPLEYVKNKIAQIKNEYTAAKTLQNEAYNPVLEKYGENLVSINPKSDFGYEEFKKYFTPKVNREYRTLLADPNFKNLHDFQSRLGIDASRIKNTDAAASDALTMVRKDATKKVQSFLSRDENALKSYNLGSAITKNQVKPYESNNALKAITKGNIKHLDPERLIGRIKNAVEKGAIPNEHQLINHLSDLESKVAKGKAAKYLSSAGLGTLGGEAIAPGMGGMLAGGIGVPALTGLASKFGAPGLSDLVQNKYVKNIFSVVKPYYYGLGRSAISQ